MSDPLLPAPETPAPTRSRIIRPSTVAASAKRPIPQRPKPAKPKKTTKPTNKTTKHTKATGSIHTPEYIKSASSEDGFIRDMGTVDILRDRERGVPRYNQFRRLLRMPTPKTFEELTGCNLQLAQELKDVDNNDIEKVVGCHSEPLPKGFGFSTVFRIFVLMASRRLKSDRFIATQWNKETYTPEGFHWVQYTTMKDVLTRHYPELAPVLKKSKNVFAPWEKLPESKKYAGIETNAP